MLSSTLVSPALHLHDDDIKLFRKEESEVARNRLAYAAKRLTKRWLPTFNFDFFGTLTFSPKYRLSMSDERGNTAFRYFMHRLNKTFYGPYYYKKGLGVSLLKVTDRDLYDGFHFHFLMVDNEAYHNKKYSLKRTIKYHWVRANETTSHIIDFEKIESLESSCDYLAFKENVNSMKIDYSYLKK